MPTNLIPNSTTIIHESLVNNGLDFFDWCLCDLIFKSQNYSKSDVKEWCTATQRHKANYLGISLTELDGIEKRLISKGFLEKHSEHQYFKATNKWIAAAY